MASALDFLGPIVKILIEFFVWYIKEVFEGSKVILRNSSTWAVIILIILVTMWFDNSVEIQKIVKECKSTGGTITNPIDNFKWPF